MRGGFPLSYRDIGIYIRDDEKKHAQISVRMTILYIVNS